MIAIINPEKLGQAHKYANLIRNKAKRQYAQAYIRHYMNGGVGQEPEHPGIGYMAAQAVRIHIDSLKLWENML